MWSEPIELLFKFELVKSLPTSYINLVRQPPEAETAFYLPPPSPRRSLCTFYAFNRPPQSPHPPPCAFAPLKFDGTTQNPFQPVTFSQQHSKRRVHKRPETMGVVWRPQRSGRSRNIAWRLVGRTITFGCVAPWRVLPFNSLIFLEIWMVYPNIRPVGPLSASAAAPPRPPRVEYLATLSRHSAAVNVVRWSPNGA